jgi:SAM-dependent methyltransferase
MQDGATLTETEIRPDALMAGQQAAFAEDIRRLMARHDEFVTVGCPACDARAAAERFQKFGMVFVECERCRTLYANPRPSKPMLEHYYATSRNYAYFNAHIFPASEQARREKLFRPRVRRLRGLVQRFGTPTDFLMEIGAGFGTFCEEVRHACLFDRVVGVEPTPALAATCRHRGIDVIEAPIERIAPDDLAADVVVSFEVIEHLFRPRDLIETCSRFLTPGGLLVLTCPNGRGFDVELMGPVSSAVDVEHLNLFNPDSIAHLLGRCGFEVLEVTTPGRLDAELVRKQVLAGRFELAGHPFLRRVLVDEWDRLGGPFQNFLAEHGLSSHMWAVGRRPAALTPRQA